MKTGILFFTFLASTLIAFSQSAPPQGINYQAMVYVPYGNQQPGVNSAGQLPANTKEVLVTFTLEEGNNGPVIYEETHTDTTDQFGLLSAIIGLGTPTSASPGLFSDIDWSPGDPYLRVSITIVEYNTTISSYQKLWSVPYALYSGYANNSAHADSSDYADIAGNGIVDVIDNGNGTLTFNYVDGSSYTTPVLTGLTGPQGPQGPAGVQGATGTGIASTTDNGDGTFTITFTDGTSFTTGNLTGPQGTPGNGIVSTTDNGNGTFTITFTDGTSFTTSNLTGPQGTPGSLDAWSLTGNAGTSPTSNFIGTTDSQDWVVKTNNAERMRVTSGGNFGINEPNPISRLQISGDLANRSNFTNQALRLFLDNSAQVRYTERLNYVGDSTQIDIDPLTTGNTGNADVRYFRSTNTSGFKAIRFLRGDGTNTNSAQIGVDGANSFFQLQGGYFGIGTATPNAELEVKSFDNYARKGQIIIDPGVYASPEGGTDVPNWIRSEYVNNTSWDLGLGGTTFNNGNPSVIIKRNGNVGIGTTSPSGKFHVNNDVSGADSSFVVTTAGKVGIGTASPNGHLTVRGGIGSTVDSAHVLLYNKYYQTGSPQLKLYSTDNSSSGAYGIQAIKAGVGSGNMVLNESGGNVGVGTSSPARTLHVNAVMRLEPIPAAPTSPAKGDMYFDSTLNKLRVYDGTTWQNCW